VSAAITFGRGKRRPQGALLELDEGDLVSSLGLFLENHLGEDAWWSGAVYTGDYRHGDKWISQRVIGLDVDYLDAVGQHAPLNEPATEALSDALPLAPCTWGHLTPRGARLVVLVDAPIIDRLAFPLAWQALYTRLSQWVPKVEIGKLEIDRTCRDLARYFWSPKATIADAVREAQIVRGSITWVPLASLLAETEEPQTHTRRKRQPRQENDVFVETIVRARKWLEKAEPAISGKHGHDIAYKVIERVVRGFDLNDDEALTALEEWNHRCQPPWSENELRHKVKDGRERGDTPLGELKNEPKKNESGGSPPHTNGQSGFSGFLDPRPVILISTELHFNVDKSVEVLKEDPHLYQRDGKLSHVTCVTREQSGRSPSVPSDDGTQKHALVEGSPQISETSIATLRERLTRYARYQKWNERLGDYKGSLPTDHIVAATHARGEWPSVRPLVGITETPTLRPDGSVVQDAGYDAATGYLYQPSEVFPRVPESPSQTDAVKALRDLLEIFVDFPYVKEKEQAHRAVPVAAILTLVARPAIQGATPAFVFDASTRGSGKTLQTDAIAMVVSGRPMPRMNYPHQEEELEKVLASYALRGAQFFSLDNVTRPFGGGALDRVITARDTVDLRVLGRSEVPTLSWRAVVMATGNNMSIYQDTARRVLLARLEPDDAQPEKRTVFTHSDLPAWTKRERARLVTAALTILRGYFVAGRPLQECDRWGSFEEWSRLIPQAIVWAGGANPMLARPESDSEVDGETGAMRVFMTEMVRLVPDLLQPGVRFKVSTVIEMLFRAPRRTENGVTVADGFDELRDAIRDICNPKHGNAPDARQLGKRLTRYRGRIIDGMKLDLCLGMGGVAQWSITKKAGT
jgi:hypothetical protein